MHYFFPLHWPHWPHAVGAIAIVATVATAWLQPPSVVSNTQMNGVWFEPIAGPAMVSFQETPQFAGVLVWPDEPGITEIPAAVVWDWEDGLIVQESRSRQAFFSDEMEEEVSE